MKNKKHIKRARKAVKTRRKRILASRVRFLKKYDEFVEKKDYKLIPRSIRGIYALLKKKANNYNVVYVGMSRTNIARRISSHIRSRSKGALWTHFTIFEMYENVYDDEIEELEGLFRVIYRKDKRANLLNKHKKFKRFKKHKISVDLWKL